MANEVQLLDVENFCSVFKLSADDFNSLMDKSPPHLKIEGSVFFILNDELIGWLIKTYKAEGDFGAGTD